MPKMSKRSFVDEEQTYDEDGDQEGSGDDTEQNNDNEQPKKRRSTRGASGAVREMLPHFFMTEQRARNNYLLCRHCVQEYNKEALLYSSGNRLDRPIPPKAIRQRKDIMRRHLDRCGNYETFVMKNGENAVPCQDDIMLVDSPAPASPPPTSKPSAVVRVKEETGPPHQSRAKNATPQQGTRVKKETPKPASSRSKSVKKEQQQDDFDLRKFYTLLTEFTADQSLVLRVIERPTFHRMIDCLRPGSSVQVQHHAPVAEKILEERGKEAEERIKENVTKARQQGHYVGLVINGWDTLNNGSLEGIMLKIGRLPFLLTAVKPASYHHAIAVCNIWEEVITVNAEDYKDRVRYFLSDDTGQCARARRILALRWPQIVWMKCWAHQVNLMVGNLMSHSMFASACDQAVQATNAVRNSPTKWYARLKDLCDQLYGSSAASEIFSLVETRWNSLQATFASLLRIRTGCRMLFYASHEDDSFPEKLLLFGDDGFWKKVEEAELLIRPLCDASFLMQRDKNTVADVLVMLVNIYKGTLDFHGSAEDGYAVAKDVQKRWLECEHPFFFLAFALHPKYYMIARKILKLSSEKSGSWKGEGNRLSAARLADAALFYYCKHELWLAPEDDQDGRNAEEKKLRLNVYLWLTGRLSEDFLFGYDSQTYPDPFDWIDVNSDALGVPLTNFAKFLLDCPVQSSSCERLSKDFSRFLTKIGNTSSGDGLDSSTKIKYDLRHKYPGEYNILAASQTFQGEKDRFISTEEHKRVDCDDDDNSFIGQNEESSTQQSAPPQQARSNQEVEFDVDETFELPQEVEETIPEEYEARELRTQLAAINCTLPYADEDNNDVLDNSSSEEEEEPMDEDEEDENDLERMAIRYANRQKKRRQEDSYEKKPAFLEPLPTENVPRYPQENKAYFSQKKYVRNDKYELSDFVWEELPFPTIMDCLK